MTSARKRMRKKLVIGKGRGIDVRSHVARSINELGRAAGFLGTMRLTGHRHGRTCMGRSSGLRGGHLNVPTIESASSRFSSFRRCRPRGEGKTPAWNPLTLAAIAPALALCMATASAQKIYWTDSTKIQRSDPDGSSIEDVLAANGLSNPIAIALDVNGGRMYWSSGSPPKIHRADLDGSHREALVTIGLIRPLGIALDLAAGKMYWADGFWNTPGKIQRANLDGTGIETLVVADANAPSGVALDIPSGKMYWTDWSTRKILRANVDGSEVEDVVTTGSSPSGIVLDLAARKMYWTEATDQQSPGRIRRADLDGSKVEDIITQGTIQPRGIALDRTEGKLYWIDSAFSSRKVQRANVDGSNVEDVVVDGFVFPWGIALDTSARKMYWTDSGTDTIKRADLIGSNIEDLFKRDVEAPRAIRLHAATGMMYWYDSTTPYHGPRRIRRASFDGSDIVDIVSDCLTEDELSLDPLRSKMYWVKSCGRQIVTRSELDGSNVEDIVNQGDFDDALTKVAVDVIGGKVYWAADLYLGGEVIRRANLDGSDAEELLSTFDVGGIAIDSWARKMYWTETGSFPDNVGSIHRANVDGSQVEDLVSTGLVWPLAITLATCEGKMYWVDRNLGKVQSANLDGTQVEDLVSGLIAPTGIALDLCGRDGPVTLPDHALFVDCMTGPATPLSMDCVCGDLSGDGRADLVDYSIFQHALAHP